MKKTKKDPGIKKLSYCHLKQRVQSFVTRFKELPGSPDHIAKGMAAGIFVGTTPTIPFHTLLAIALAIILGGSKRAAAVGVWLGTPIVPFLYLSSYKVGTFFLSDLPPLEVKAISLSEVLSLGLDVTCAMLIGGVIVGILPGVAAYFITRKIFTTIRFKKYRLI
jgi:uncharacterized protein (DUF2062 family)